MKSALHLLEPVPPAANFYGLTLEAGCQALLNTAYYYLLGYQGSGITWANSPAYTQDKLH